MTREATPPTGPSSGTTLPQAAQPDKLSELLRDLARLSESERGSGWDAELRPGAMVGRFELVREVGRGGFGLVWEAKDRFLGRGVAFKAVQAGADLGNQGERPQREAAATAMLSHPNIVTLLDAGMHAAGPYLIYELLKGETLGRRLDRKRMPVEEVLRVLLEVTKGIAHAHSRGVVHRDLKPANVFLCEDGQVKVLDLGLAHAFGVRADRGGTTGYMAPEQYTDAPQDERVDVFALGVLAFRALTGEVPFSRERDLRSSARASRLEIEELPELGTLVAHMLEKDPLRRPREAGAVLVELDRIARRLGPAELEPVRVRRWPGLRRAAPIALGVLLGLAGAYVLSHNKPVTAAIVHGVHRIVDLVRTRIVVAVADLDNQTGDPKLDGLAGMLITSLDYSPRLSVVGPLLYRSGPETTAKGSPLGKRAAQAAVRRAGASLLLVPTLRRLGELYVLDVRVTDTDGMPGHPLRGEERGEENLPRLINRVAEQFRLQVGEDDESVRSTPSEVDRTYSRNVDALNHFFQGESCVEVAGFATGYGRCLDDMKRAVTIDPDFALAHLRISEVSRSEGLPQSAQRAALEPALRLRNLIPARYELRLRGWDALLAGRDVEAKMLLEKAARESLDDKFAWQRAGEVPFHRDEYAESVRFFREVHRLDPKWIEAAEHLITALGCTGDLDAIRQVARGLEAHGRNPTALTELCLARLWIEPARAIATCEEAVAAGGGRMGEEYLAIALVNLGEHARSKAQFAMLATGDANSESFGHYGQMQLATQEGRWRDALEMMKGGNSSNNAWTHAGYLEALAGLGDPARVAREAIRTRDIDPALLRHAAVHLAYLGDLRSAEEFARFLPVSSPRSDTYRALVLWRQGDLPGALAELRRVAQGSPVSADPAMTHPLYLLGEALAEAGRDAEAVDALERFLSIPLTYPSWMRPRALFRLALSQERLGRTSEASTSTRRLFEYWAHADPEQPFIEEARAMARRLGIP